MITITEDNICSLIKEDEIYFIGVHNETKFPKKTQKIKDLVTDLESHFPLINFLYLDCKTNPKSVDFIFKGGVEYYPLFGILEGSELVEVYFGDGLEETYEFLKIYYENNN